MPLHQQLKSSIDYILGDKKDPFRYTHHAMLIFAALAHFSGGIFNYCFSVTPTSYALYLIAISLFILGLWYFSRFHHLFTLMAVLFNLLIALVNLPLNWFFNAGSDGGTLMIYLIGFLYSAVIFHEHPRWRFIIPVIFACMPCFLILLEISYPELLYPYPSLEIKQLDLFFSYILSGVCLLFLLEVYGRRFQLERDRAQQLAEALRFMAERDNLTHLYNRHSLQKYFAHWQNKHADFWLCIFDLDFFKQVNDQHGHAYGDYVLRTFAAALAQVADQYKGIAGRHGGEEFVLLVPPSLGHRPPQAVQDLRVLVAHLDLAKGAITFSGGCVRVAWQESLDTALHRADQLLYQAKARGRDQVLYQAN
ncbi:diguanylate cyclase (GGDEF) domain-containing protein [Allopseudospirillum japonicum]|uniref:diguanylate cyclase n=1 Tax=Allopseudospirillum japonicum TaxID=64971 RepID=A0A1H6UVV3_9GAMM|nr:GGDEF domain-containing protein [Allopseudospirillum japonicum]SEI92205.1 diguanylate cyclase (GGDEF) domain-containing protein [Allopseudospirillum japonicum]